MVTITLNTINFTFINLSGPILIKISPKSVFKAQVRHTPETACNYLVTPKQQQPVQPWCDKKNTNYVIYLVEDQSLTVQGKVGDC